jgi:hypothetical protein
MELSECRHWFFPPAAVGGRRPVFFRAVPQDFFTAPSQVQKNGDQETLKHDPHKKEDDMVYGGTPDSLWPRCFLTDDSTLLLMSHDLR